MIGSQFYWEGNLYHLQQLVIGLEALFLERDILRVFWLFLLSGASQWFLVQTSPDINLLFPNKILNQIFYVRNVDVWPQSSDSKKKRSFKSFNFNGQYLDDLSPGCKISPFTVYLPVYQGYKWKTSLCKGRTAEPAVEASWFGTGCEGSILNWTHQGGIQNSRCGIQHFL